VASRWQRVGDLIGSGYELLTSRTRSDHLCYLTVLLPLIKKIGSNHNVNDKRKRKPEFIVYCILFYS